MLRKLCLSVCVSVRLSVTLMSCLKTANSYADFWIRVYTPGAYSTLRCKRFQAHYPYPRLGLFFLGQFGHHAK